MAERIPDREEVEVREKVAVYEVPTDETINRDVLVNRTVERPEINTTTVVNPVDRVRWGPILAGLFAAISTMVVLNVLGLAIGFSAYDAGNLDDNLGLGASIWGTVSTLIAFVVGGWLAARTAATTGYGNGILNGIMVWVVTIPLLLYLLGASVGSLLNLTGGLIATGTEIMAPLSAQLNLPVEEAADEAAAAVPEGDLAEQAAPAAEEALDIAGTTAWGTLLALILGLGAATLGGLIGARPARAYAYPRA